MTGSGPLSLLPTLFPNPKIANLPIMKDLNGFDSFRKCMDAMDDLIKPYIEQHKKTFDPNDLRDFIDVYIAEMKATKNPNVRRSRKYIFWRTLQEVLSLTFQSNFFGEKGNINLRNILMDFFLAGSDTTSTSLLWSMLYMIQFPSIQVFCLT